jgi:hypothetical protein
MVEPKSQSRKGAARMRRKTKPARLGFIFIGIFFIVVVAVYLFFIFKIFEQNNRATATDLISPGNITVAKVVHEDEDQRVLTVGNTQRHRYDDWKKLAVQLAELPPDEILSVLRTQDPFGVRRFEERLLQMESDKQAILKLDEIRQLFPCPTEERITLPDQRNHELARKYRQGLSQLKQSKEDFVFLFFQHLRKAGGTNFCGLAERNLLKPQVPQYFCMPDFHWDTVRKCAGCLLAYSNEEISSRMTQAGHRILGNEWENFDSRFFDLPAVFATSFRRPLDRALSQFRFECIEDRGCRIKQVEPWWEKRKDLTNVYIWTFAKMPTRMISVAKTKEAAQKRKEAMGKALDTVARYNLVLAMEWLAYAGDHTRDVLGFTDTSTMTERIRPHINQAKRTDGQEHNQLGAAGIAKASWTPENYLSKEQYKIMSEDLALDEILTDAARRMFLERIVCDDMSEAKFLDRQ